MNKQTVNIQEALQYHQHGDLSRAEQLYKQILLANPHHPDALHLLGVICSQSGNYSAAIDYISKAISFKPNSAQFHNNLGNALKAQGRFDESISCFNKALHFKSDFAEAYHNLGDALDQLGKTHEAIECYQKALKIRPEFAEAHMQMGVALKALGRLKEAERSYKEAIRIRPEYGEAYNNLGVVYKEQERWEEAKSCYEKAIEMMEEPAAALNNMGSVLSEEGKGEEAIGYFKEALDKARGPLLAEIFFNLGNSFHKKGECEEAIKYYRQALYLRPNYLDAINNMGSAFLDAGDFEKALDCFNKCINLDEEYVKSYINLSYALIGQGKAKDALVQCEKALELKPDLAEAHNCLGNVLKELERIEESIVAFRKALELNPKLLEAYQNLGYTFNTCGDHKEALECFEQAIRFSSKAGLKIMAATVLPGIPESYEEIIESRRCYEEKISELLSQDLKLDIPEKEIGQIQFFLAYQGFNDLHLQRKITELYTKACPSLLYKASHCNDNYALELGRPIKLGFISRCFTPNHIIAKTIEGVVSNLSREKFFVTILHIGALDKDLAQCIKPNERAIQVPPNLKIARQMIADLKLDILYFADIGMDALTYFLAFSRLAPVQCTDGGHPFTSGIGNIDYFLSSEVDEIENAQDHYSEKLVRFKQRPSYYKPSNLPDVLQPRSFYGLAEDKHIYICPMTPFKFHPEFDDVLATILRRDPLGQVVIPDYKNLTMKLMNRFKKSMPDVVDRVITVGRQPMPLFLNLILVSDVMLDTMHFGGATTCREALSIGTPIVTLPGEFLRGRYTYGYYKQMGYTECVVKSKEEYVELALRLANDKDYRGKVRTEILSRKQALEEDDPINELENFFIDAVRNASS
jgi:protein O-GlcNAc transferase